MKLKHYHNKQKKRIDEEVKRRREMNVLYSLWGGSLSKKMTPTPINKPKKKKKKPRKGKKK